MAPWAGFGSDVLQGVADLIEGAAVPGLKAVMVGEQYRGYENPSAFVFVGQGGIRRDRDAGRHGEEEWLVPVRVVVVKKTAQKSDDLAVQAMLEDILDVLDAGSPPGDAHNMEVVNAGSVLPLFRDSDGGYQTNGSIEVIYRKAIARPR